jgi:flagellar basal-body rod modification protein FlgD
MAAAAGIWNQMAAGHALTGATASPADTTTGGTGNTDSSSSSSTISANDFLTLLVTEMQNQDPTANTDPNEYINQLVQVNSLEQLIDINQNLNTALGDPNPSGTTGHAVPVTAGAGEATPSASATQASPSVQHKAAALAAAQNAVSAMPSPTAPATGATAVRHAPGNLSVPNAQPAAQKVAHSLNGRSHPHSIPGSAPGAR